MFPQTTPRLGISRWPGPADDYDVDLGRQSVSLLYRVRTLNQVPHANGKSIMRPLPFGWKM